MKRIIIARKPARRFVGGHAAFARAEQRFYRFRLLPVPEGTTRVADAGAVPDEVPLPMPAPKLGVPVDCVELLSVIPAPLLRVTPCEASEFPAPEPPVPLSPPGTTGIAGRTGTEPVLVPVGASPGVVPRAGVPTIEPVFPEEAAEV